MCNVKKSCLALLTWATFLVSQTSAGKHLDFEYSANEVVVAIEPRAWLQNTVTPHLFGVGEQTDIDWRFMSPQQVRDGDCITIRFVNPYADDSPDSYISFDQRNSFQCGVSRYHF